MLTAATTNAFGTAIDNGYYRHLQWNQPELTTLCPGSPFGVCKEMTMIAPLKQHYEYYHAGDVTALKKLYEYHAENCVKAAEITVDTRQREEYLNLARQWTEAAAVLQTRRH